MATDVYEALEDVYPKIVRMMDDEFDSHRFILALAQQYQKLYIHALYKDRGYNRPFHRVHMVIAKRLKKRSDLVKHIGNKLSPNIFGEQSKVAVWRKVKK